MNGDAILEKKTKKRYMHDKSKKMIVAYKPIISQVWETANVNP